MTVLVQHYTRKLGTIVEWWPVGLLGVLIIFAVFAPWIAPLDPDRQNLLARLKPPGFETRVGGPVRL